MVCMNVHCPVYIHYIPPFFNEKMSPEKLEFFAQFTATMIYNEEVSLCLEHITFIEHIYVVPTL